MKTGLDTLHESEMDLTNNSNNHTDLEAKILNRENQAPTYRALFFKLNDGTSNNPYMSKLSVFNIPRNLKNEYDRFALISYDDQLDLLDINDEKTLIVTTDWLTWRKCVDQDRHCLHVDSALAEWPDEWSDADLHHQKCSEWMYLGGEDITVFRGVSLGKQFTKELAMLIRTYLLHRHSLHRMCRTFQPKQIIYFDICTDTDHLDAGLKLSVVESVAKSHKIELINRSNEVNSKNHQHPDIGYIHRVVRRSKLRDVVRGLYETVIDFIFSLHIKPSNSKPRVFILLNWLALNGMLQNYNSQNVTPVILAGQLPKTVQFFMNCWRRGVYLVKLPNVRLSRKDRQDIETMCEKLKTVFQDACSDVEKVGRNYIQNKIIAAGRIETKAVEIKQFDKLFQTKNISHVLVGDAENSMCRLILELANRDDIQRDELLNGLFMTHQYYDVRSGDHVHNGYVSRQLSWGKRDEVWRELKTLKIQSVYTGYPALDGLKPVSEKLKVGFEKALVLPLAIGEGVKSLRSNEFCVLVDTLQMLKEHGFTDLRIKLHASDSILPYYRKVTEYFGIECEIFQQGDLADHVEWADIVIGPINSGGLVETLAMGKPYYPMRVHPSSLREELFCGVKPRENMRDLRKAIEEGDYPDSESTLEFFCSRTTIPNAASKTWEVLEESVKAN